MDSYLEKAPFITPGRERELLSFCSEHGLSFNDLRYLNLAFTHKSFTNEAKMEADNNERLEFLGDSVLGLVTAEYLFKGFTSFHEGDFSKIKASVVSEESLAEVASSYGIDRYILMGRGEEMQGGKHKKAVLADCMEAIIAAIFLDQGLDAARTYVLSFMAGQVEKYLKNQVAYKDYKTILQEYLQKKRRELPLYRVIGQSGPDHDQEFTVVVEFDGRKFGPAKGKNKKSAEQASAHLALVALGLEKA